MKKKISSAIERAMTDLISAAELHIIQNPKITIEIIDEIEDMFVVWSNKHRKNYECKRLAKINDVVTKVKTILGDDDFYFLEKNKNA